MPIFLEIPGFGLSNRIRTVLAFDYIAKKQHRGPLYVFWLVNHMCPDHFDNLFQAIPGLILIKNYGEFQKLRKQNRGALYYKGQAQFHSLVNNYTKANMSGSIKPSGHSLAIYKQEYSLLKPLPEIWQEIQTFIDNHQIKNRIGLHIRRTDHVSFIKRVAGHFDTDAHFEQIIRRDPKQLFYISTDNLETQQKFLNKFPNQLVTYSEIPNVKSIRKTSVVHAVIDLYLLGNCKQVQGSFGSSFSEFAYRLNDIWANTDGFRSPTTPVCSATLEGSVCSSDSSSVNSSGNSLDTKIIIPNKHENRKKPEKNKKQHHKKNNKNNKNKSGQIGHLVVKYAPAKKR